ncbi:type I polyketide synthase [Streptomyces sp. BK205]|uniref:type I polyketide synthase n=1 Tax=Streptomyces sp. BK205 TaxID=2512164 RepID=UPI00104FA67F|nr:type I polyketide synthase [Streptomyces sp. BK205]TCR16056.1 phthiocerol/phenolphthiocerol synthesis type-I polyketide synthase D/myxalamid-type polyketide synthase MxaE and MxaD [Streptomyces sp. BK205]
MDVNPTRLRRWLLERLAARLGVTVADVDPELPFSALGVDSRAVAALALELSEHLGEPVDPAVLFESPTVAALVARLTGPAGDRPTPVVAPPERGDGIALVGISARAPGAESADDLWRLLQDGRDPIRTVTREGWHLEGLPEAERGATYAGQLSDVASFDARFFRIPREEARRMDPQHRLVLQGVWEAFEDAGIVPQRLRGTATGVYLGISANEYGRRQVGDVGTVHALTPTGNALSTAAGRVSYWFDLRGPSLAVDTACSSSLVALHLAVRALRTGECDTAVVAGVNLLLEPDISVSLARGGMLAPDGRCRPFDASAQGYVRAEGCLAVVLKPLARARADGDRVYAVVKGTAVNQDGGSNGLTAPNPAAQEAVLAAAYADAGVAPSDVDYVECHGTGTPLGDPIEARSLAAVVGAGRDATAPCLIGSVKSNLGHLEAAAGLAGVVKTALALHHGHIPGNLHYRETNPRIDLAGLGLRVVASGTAWPDTARPRLAGVSSFGFGGTNAHVVLGAEARDEADRAVASPRPLLVPVSAQDPETLAAAASRLADWLDTRQQADLPAVAATAAHHRTHHAVRLAVVGTSLSQVSSRLRAAAPPAAAVPAEGRLVFAFPGQAALAPPALLALAEHDERVAMTLRRCDEVIEESAGWSLLDVLTRDDEAELRRTDIAQPVAVAAQIALTAMWQGLGVRPDAVIGHSLGEVGAAVACGALSLEQALRVALARGHAVLPTIGTGRMLVLSVPEAEAAEQVSRFPGRIAVAAVNGPRSVVLSGDGTALETICAEEEAAGRLVRWVPVDYPSHSPWMSAAADELGTSLTGLRAGSPVTDFWSTLHGTLYEGPLDAGYWADNLRRPVRFAHGAAGLLEAGVAAVVELGSHPVLRTPLRQIAGERPLVFVSSMERGTDPVEHVLEGMARLYETGVDPRWDRVTPAARPVALPAYPWRRDRHWISRPAPSLLGARPTAGLLGAELDLAAADGRRRWELRMPDEPLPVVAGHVINGTVVMPAAAFVEMTLTAGRALGITGPIEASDIRLRAVLPLSGPGVRVQTVVEPGEGPSYSVRILAKSEQDGDWRLHATANVAPAQADAVRRPDLDEVPDHCTRSVPTGHLYDTFRSLGLEYGPDYRLLDDIRSGTGLAVAKLLTDTSPDSRCVVDPRQLDAAFQLSAPAHGAALDARPMPYAIDSVSVTGTPGQATWALAEVVGETAHGVLLTTDGKPVVAVRGLRLRTARPTPGAPAGSAAVWRYRSAWRAQDPPAAEGIGTVGTWLVAAPERGLSAEVAERLRAAGATVRVVTAGPAYAYAPAETSTLDVTRRDHWKRLLNEPGCVEPGPLNIVCLDAEDDRFDATAAVTSVTMLGALVGEVSVRTLADRRLWVVSRGSHRVVPEDTVVRPTGAGMWGVARVLPFEVPLLRTRCVDLPAQGEQTALAAELVEELARPTNESEVALRHGRRFVARLVPLGPPETSAPDRIRRNAGYLIVGGSGALGLHVARWLGARGARHIGLMARRETSPAVREAIAELEAAGTRVHVLQGDVGDPAAVAQAVTRLREQAPLAGVVVAAGVLRDAPLLDLSQESIEEVMWSKVRGLTALDEAVAPDDLDWFVHFSSAAAVLGSPGQAAYCAANAVVDAFGAYQRVRGRNALVINWGPWGKGGLATGAVRDEGRMAAAYTSLDPVDGIREFAAVLHEQRPQSLVMPTNLRNLVQFYPGDLGVRRFAEVTAGSELLLRSVGLGAEQTERRSLKQAYVAPESPLEQRIAAVWQASLGMDRIGVHDGFFEMGGDSVFANQMVLEVNRALQVSIEPARAFEELTIAHLAELAEQDMLGQLESMTDEQAADLLYRIQTGSERP